MLKLFRMCGSRWGRACGKDVAIKKLRKVSRLPYSFKYTIIYKTTIVRLSIPVGIVWATQKRRGLMPAFESGRLKCHIGIG